jgi:hypothetical protein
MQSNFELERRTIRSVGRPLMHTETYTKATVVLLNRQIVYLDRLSADIRATSGAVVKRAEIIRGLIDALAESGEDLSNLTSEVDVKERFLRAGARPSPKE